MSEELMKETKIGEKLSMGASYKEDEVAIFVASEDVSCSCAFLFKEWRLFVKNVNEINARLKTSP